MSVDVDDLVAKISAGIYGDDRMTWDTIEAATSALSQLVAEVERLRGERAAVVAYLAARGGICLDLADDIERDDHCREEAR